jgi:rRNA maturation endonuclease Nob1
MELLPAVAVALGLLVAVRGVYRGVTKRCWACEQRLAKWTHVCTHCGRRSERGKASTRSTARRR